MERGGARTAAIWAVLRQEISAQRGDRPLDIVDLGGGTGGFAVPLAEAGHSVTVIDPSPDALAALLRRAAEAGVADRVHGLQGDADSLGLTEPGQADLVLCHAVLEVVDDPAAVAGALAKALRPGGAASIVVANRAATVLARAIAGQFRTAESLLRDATTRIGPRDPLLRRFDADSASALLDAAGLKVERVHGVRVVADLMPGALADSDPDALVSFELAASVLPPYRDLATQLHFLARR